MCKILNVAKVNQHILLDCSEYEGDFSGATVLKISNGTKEITTKSFILDKTRNCFSQHNAPWIMLTQDIDEQFLKIGNDINLQ